jgi:hypothetical protein
LETGAAATTPAEHTPAKIRIAAAETPVSLAASPHLSGTHPPGPPSTAPASSTGSVIGTHLDDVGLGFGRFEFHRCCLRGRRQNCRSDDAHCPIYAQACQEVAARELGDLRRVNDELPYRCLKTIPNHSLPISLYVRLTIDLDPDARHPGFRRSQSAGLMNRHPSRCQLSLLTSNRSTLRAIVLRIGCRATRAHTRGLPPSGVVARSKPASADTGRVCG